MKPFYSSKYELIRKLAIVFRGLILQKRSGFILALTDLLHYLIKSYVYSEQKVVQLRLKGQPSLYIRTRSSDLEVFVQHFIYNELEPLRKKNLAVSAIVDAGANIGMTTRMLSGLYPGKVIKAIEPDQENMKMLKLNCEYLIDKKLVECYQAIFYPNKAVNLTFDNSGDSWSFQVSEQASAIQSEHVVVTPVDVISKPANVLVKMDIEGSELAFIEHSSMPDIVLNHHLLVELHGGSTYLKYFARLSQLGCEKVQPLGEFWYTSPTDFKNGNALS